MVETAAGDEIGAAMPPTPAGSPSGGRPGSLHYTRGHRPARGPRFRGAVGTWRVGGVMLADQRRAGSVGERELQERCGTTRRAAAFYREQVLGHLNEAMRQFIGRMEMVFVATADANGNCDCSLRVGPPGFVRTIDDRTLAYPEYRGNGVMASQGNIVENGHVGLFFADFLDSTVGLHVNGSACLAENVDLLRRPEVPQAMRDDIALPGGRRPERWVVVQVDEAYIHCSKHVPQFSRRDKAISWGTDEARLKGGDYFGARADRQATPPSGG